MFEWDSRKNAVNYAKHGISFEEAVTIFEGPILARRDDRQDYGEERYISMGVLSDVLVIVVAHTDRRGRTRIISARKANRTERAIYYEHLEKTLGRN